MQKLLIHFKSGTGWQTLTPDYRKTTAADFRQYHNQAAMIEWHDYCGVYYGYGTLEMRDRLLQKHRDKLLVMMDVPGFANYWQYKLLEFGVDTFSKVENAEERTAIMSAEGETDEAIDAYLATRPDLYERPQQQEIWPEDF